ncbi:hypothetical protein C0431_10010 [bacterium]|nr:hypothetical protein [bacterium]
MQLLTRANPNLPQLAYFSPSSRFFSYDGYTGSVEYFDGATKMNPVFPTNFRGNLPIDDDGTIYGVYSYPTSSDTEIARVKDGILEISYKLGDSSSFFSSHLGSVPSAVTYSLNNEYYYGYFVAGEPLQARINTTSSNLSGITTEGASGFLLANRTNSGPNSSRGVILNSNNNETIIEPLPGDTFCYAIGLLGDNSVVGYSQNANNLQTYFIQSGSVKTDIYTITPSLANQIDSVLAARGKAIAAQYTNRVSREIGLAVIKKQ